MCQKVRLDVAAGSTSGVKVKLGVSSCNFDLRSNFELDLSRSTNKFLMRLGETNPMVLK